jgi:hypothetical protein
MGKKPLRGAMYDIEPESMGLHASATFCFEDEPTIANCSDFTKQHQSRKATY